MESIFGEDKPITPKSVTLQTIYISN